MAWKSDSDDDDIFELDEDEVVERLVKVLLADENIDVAALFDEVEVDIKRHTMRGLDDLDELAKIFRDDTSQSQNPTAHFITLTGTPPTEEVARKQVREWLNVRNPAFGNATPKDFLSGDEDQQLYFKSFIESIESSLFS